MRVGLITMASNENLYIRDWVEYNKEMGFDNIIFVDNSPSWGDFPQYVIGDYIADGFVIYENRRHDTPNEDLLLEHVYTEMYEKYCNDFDYICIFDVDEYFTFNEAVEFKTIKDYLASDIVKDAEQIKINWRVYNDNGLVHYDSRPVYERFKEPTQPDDVHDWTGDYPVNSTTKLIFNCNLTKHADYVISKSPHIAVTDHWGDPGFKCVSASGQLVRYNSGCAPIDFSVAYLRHYRTLTIEEFLFRRFTRGDKDARGVCHAKLDLIKMFASENKITVEKKDVIENFFRTAGRDYGKNKSGI